MFTVLLEMKVDSTLNPLVVRIPILFPLLREEFEFNKKKGELMIKEYLNCSKILFKTFESKLGRANAPAIDRIAYFLVKNWPEPILN